MRKIYYDFLAHAAYLKPRRKDSASTPSKKAEGIEERPVADTKGKDATMVPEISAANTVEEDTVEILNKSKRKERGNTQRVHKKGKN